MPTLSEYGSSHGEAILILREKGWQVWRDDYAQMYCAEKDGWDFMAGSPTALLGLVAIYEYKKPARCTEYWWRSEPFPSYDPMPTKPERAYVSRTISDREPPRPKPPLPPALDSLVRRIVELLAAGRYGELEQLTGGRGLSAMELEQRVRAWGGTLVVPHNYRSAMSASKVEDANPATWAVRVIFWSSEDERDDLWLELTIVEHDAGPAVSIDKI